MDFAGNNALWTVLTLLLFGATSLQRSRVCGDHNDRIDCPLPAPCFNWEPLRSCNMGHSIQVAGNGTGIFACSNPPDETWYRGYRYLPYQFDLIEDGDDADSEPGGIIAVSRCIRRTFGLTPDRTESMAIFRGPIIVPTECLVFRVTFWYRLSDPPVFDPANPLNEFHFKVLIEDNGQSFPVDLIWGHESDYATALLNQWNFAEASFGRDTGARFTINWLAYHNDNCLTNVKSITLDMITIDNAVGCPTTVTTTTPTTTTTTTTTTTSTTTTTATTATTPSPPTPPTSTTTSTTSTTPTTPTTPATTTTSPTTTTVPLVPDPVSSTPTTTQSTPTSTPTTPPTTPSTATPVITISTNTTTSDIPDTSTTTPTTPTTNATAPTPPVTETNATSTNTTVSPVTNTTSAPTGFSNSTDSSPSVDTEPTSNVTGTTPTPGSSPIPTANGTTSSSPTSASPQPPNVCNGVNCGFGECTANAASYECRCRQGFVQDHPRAICRCPATMFSPNATSGCLDAPLSLETTYQFSGDFQSDLSDNSSAMYLKWSSEIEETLRDEITKDLTLGTDIAYLLVKVRSFRNGSIITDILITVGGYEAGREAVIKATILEAVPAFVIDGSSLMVIQSPVSGYFNRCVAVEGNSACGSAHRCNFDNSTGKAACLCNPGYEFDANRKTCIQLQIVAPTSTPQGDTDALYIALYAISGVVGAAIIIFAGLFARKRYINAKKRRPLPEPPVYQARTNQSRQQRHDAIYASIDGDYGGAHSRREYLSGAVRTPSIRSTTSSMPDYDLDMDELQRRSSGYAGSLRSTSSFHPSEQSYELYGVLPARKQRQY
ncbi:mucin-13-like [Paramacrobiotus metropolitanus]|uniref:mucin-13-like n=1 Tax=Paramacrobiotus metropolitanus TaxID=2943436 RepID=UPI002445FB53|nr:mucin-13-like [Paramacrobiotus metropolitanus]